MDCVTILAQTVETANHTLKTAAETIVPLDTLWKYITSLNLIEALTFMSFGVVCLLYGWRVFKVLVAICFGVLGIILGTIISAKTGGENARIWGAVIGLVAMAVLSMQLLRWAVFALGAVAGGTLTSGLWYACNLPEQYIWAGALVGIVAGGMIAFIVFKIAVMLFTSLGGSALIVVGSLALLYLYPDTRERVQEVVFTKRWFLPAVLLLPTLLGVYLQNRFIKSSKDWNI